MLSRQHAQWQYSRHSRGSWPLSTQGAAITKARNTALRSSSKSSSMTKQKFQQQSWRWFGFDTETTGLNVEKDCVIQFAAYDLESGASYTALVNPAYHKPRYVFSTEAYRVHGIEKSLLASEGIPLTDAFAGLVTFINDTTPPGHTPALVAHTGFKFHFPMMQHNLQQAAAAAAATKTEASDPRAADIASGTTGRRRRRHAATLPTLEATSAVGLHQQQQAQDAGWPSDWTFHDTFVMAACLKEMQPADSKLKEALRDLRRSSLAAALLPPPYTEDDVQPSETAYAHAASVARLTAVLLGLLQSPAQLAAEQQQQLQHSSHFKNRFGITCEESQQFHDIHVPWLSRPWPLEYSTGLGATAARGAKKRKGMFGSGGPLSMCPPGMVQAALQAAETGPRAFGCDPVVATMNGYYSPYATGLYI